MMPTDTPDGTRSRTAPRKPPNETPAARSAASSRAVCTAALAIGWPLIRANSGSTRCGSPPAAYAAGASQRRITSAAPSTYSPE